MNNAIHTPVKSLPESLKSALRSVEYGAADIAIEASDTVGAMSQGGAGQRGFVLVVDIASGEMTRHDGAWGGASAFDQRQVDLDSNTYTMRPGMAVIHGCIGYPRTFATITLHPENVAKFLPAAPTVTERERSLLKDFCGLTSAGRKDQWSRYPESAPSEAELDSLVARGLLARNKAGATKITTEGKNAAGSRF